MIPPIASQAEVARLPDRSHVDGDPLQQSQHESAMMTAMLAAYAAAIRPRRSARRPRRSVERPEPEPPAGWVTVKVTAASLNHHDLWSLRGVGLPAERLPMILGCDAAGVDPDGNEVLVHAVIGSEGWSGDETLDPKRTLLSELHQGTLAERVMVPRRNLVPKPAELSFEQAACLPTAWLTAYRMLFTRGRPDARPDRARAGLERRRRHGADQARLERRAFASGPQAAPRRSARWRSHSAPTPPSSRGRACPSASTR